MISVIHKNGMYNIEKRLEDLCEEAGKLLRSAEGLSGKELLQELPALRLRVRFLKSSFLECEEELKKMKTGPEDQVPDTMAVQLQAMISSELRWLQELEASYEDCSRACELSAVIEKNKKAKEFKSKLSG